MDSRGGRKWLLKQKKCLLQEVQGIFCQQD